MLFLKKTGLLIILILFLIHVYQYAGTRSIELISNNSFEQNLDNWNPWSWKVGAICESTRIKSRQGDNALIIKIENEENSASVFQTVKVKPKTCYRLSGWISTENVKIDRAGAALGIYDSFYITKTITGTKNWTYVEMFFKTAGNQDTVEICASLGLCGSITTGTVYYDDISLIESNKIPAKFYFDLDKKNKESVISLNPEIEKKTIHIPLIAGIIAAVLVVSGFAIVLINRKLRVIVIANASRMLKALLLCIRKNKKLIVKTAFFAFLFFFIRSNWQNTFEFGYDQARISEIITTIIKEGDYLNVNRHIFHSVTEDVATFGPFLIYFFIPFYLLTRDPQIITHLLIVFNFLGILFTYLAAKLLYNKRVAFFVTLFFIAFPWSVIFSRMIYNPTPLFCFIPLVLYTTLLIVKKNRQKLLFVLPVFWGMMMQFHYISTPVALLSFLYIVLHFKTIKWHYFLIGIAIGILPWIPLLKSEIDTNFRFVKGVLSARNLLIKSDWNLWETTRLALEKMYTYLSLQEIDAHISFGKEIVYTMLPSCYFVFHTIYIILFFTGIGFFIIKLFIKRKADDLFVFLWFISVPVFLILTFNLSAPPPPRYYIISFLPFAFITGNAIDAGLLFLFKLLKKIRVKNKNRHVVKFVKYLSYSISAVFLCFFFIFMITYYDFILVYDYTEPGFFGWLHPDSSPPYSFTYDALNYAMNVSRAQGYDKFVFSYDMSIIDNYHCTDAQKYIWEKVFKQDLEYSEKLPFYFIAMGIPPRNVPAYSIKRFGPFRVFRKSW